MYHVVALPMPDVSRGSSLSPVSLGSLCHSLNNRENTVDYDHALIK